MNKPILFLDLDGIVNSENLDDELTELWLNDRNTGIHYCQPLVENLSRFIKANNFNIVLSSTWRLDFTFYETKQILSQWRIDADRLIDVTPNMGQDRHHDISKWLEINQDTDDVQYPYFFILDDDSDAWTDNIYFHKVDVRHGFTKEEEEKANKLISNIRREMAYYVDKKYTIDSVYTLLELQKILFAQGYLWKNKGASYNNVNYVDLVTTSDGYIYWNPNSVVEICHPGQQTECNKLQLLSDISESRELYEDQEEVVAL